MQKQGVSAQAQGLCEEKLTKNACSIYHGFTRSMTSASLGERSSPPVTAPVPAHLQVMTRSGVFASRVNTEDPKQTSAVEDVASAREPDRRIG